MGLEQRRYLFTMSWIFDEGDKSVKNPWSYEWGSPETFRHRHPGYYPGYKGNRKPVNKSAPSAAPASSTNAAVQPNIPTMKTTEHGDDRMDRVHAWRSHECRNHSRIADACDYIRTEEPWDGKYTIVGGEVPAASASVVPAASAVSVVSAGKATPKKKKVDPWIM